MNWQEKLKNYNENKDWENAIALIESTIASTPDDAWAYIYCIYFFHNILLEEMIKNYNQKRIMFLIKKYFQESESKFSENAEYLFFIGKILHIAEWYFGLDDNQLAFVYQEKSVKLEPNNILYEWAYRSSLNGDAVANYLANQILLHEVSIINWLISKGLPGNYILTHLRMSSEKYSN